MNSNQSFYFGDGVIIFDGTGLVPSNGDNLHGHSRHCTDIPIREYFGSEKKNVFHTQLMIGVVFGFMMQCRIPIMLTVLNFIVRSGGSFKPKIIPMFIDKTTLRTDALYGSSYRLLDQQDREQFRDLLSDDWNSQEELFFEDSSSEEDESADNSD